MNPIIQGVESGYSPEEIIQFISKAMPQMIPKISKAINKGYGIKEILGFLSKSTPQDTRGLSETEIHSRNRENDNRLVQNGLMAAGSAIAAPLAANAARSALSRALPQSLAPVAQSLANSNNTVANSSPIPQQSPMSPMQSQQATNTTGQQLPNTSSQPPLNNPNAASIPEPSNIQQPKQNSNIVDRLYSSFEKGRDKGFDFESDAFLKIAKRMKSTGEIRNKEDFERFFNLFDAKKNEGKDLPTALKEASSEYDNQKLSPQIENQPEIGQIPEVNEKISPEIEKQIDLSGMGKGMTDNLYNGLFESLQKGSSKFAGIEDPILKKAKEPFEKGLIKSPEDLRKFVNEQPEYSKKQENPKIEKNSVVSSPNGVGEVKEIRNGQALVEVDGKLHKVKEEDLEASPMPEKDLAELYDDLIKGIEKDTEEDVSRMVQWAGYNPETNTLQFLPHTGKLYKYGNISPEDAALLTDILSTRKTTGSNFIGAWKKDSKSPIGAALSKLIRKLQSERGGKGNEYEETHEPIYSAYEPAIEAKKEKLRKKKKI